MKKAVIQVAGKQYFVREGETIDVDLQETPKESELKPEVLLTIDGDNVAVGSPQLTGTSVKVEMIEPDIKGDKLTAIRYKAKKRVHKTRGHRQHYSRIKILEIDQTKKTVDKLSS
jgi:large subunit ribosomal protein L21